VVKGEKIKAFTTKARRDEGVLEKNKIWGFFLTAIFWIVEGEKKKGGEVWGFGIVVLLRANRRSE